MRRQAPSAHRSRCSRSFITFGRHCLRRITDTICLSLALLAHSALSGDPTHITRTESHTHTHTQADRCRLPIARVARSFSAFSVHRSRCSLIQCFWETPLISLAQNHMIAESHTQTGAICPSLVLLAHSALSGFRRPHSFQSHR